VVEASASFYFPLRAQVVVVLVQAYHSGQVKASGNPDASDVLGRRTVGDSQASAVVDRRFGDADAVVHVLGSSSLPQSDGEATAEQLERTSGSTNELPQADLKAVEAVEEQPFRGGPVGEMEAYFACWSKIHAVVGWMPSPIRETS
jgi:hypothetical protein